MKIQNDGLGALPNAAEALSRAKAAEQQKGTEKSDAAAGGRDGLQVSAEAQLLGALTEQAAEPPAIRQELVDRMKALVDAGKVGADTGALADAIIDDLTGRS